jgi:Peroxide stress protein YaaA
MITVISPAKRLNETAMPDLALTAPLFAKPAQQLAKIARRLTAADLSALMDISPALGALNHGRFQNFGQVMPQLSYLMAIPMRGWRRAAYPPTPCIGRAGICAFCRGFTACYARWMR